MIEASRTSGVLGWLCTAAIVHVAGALAACNSAPPAAATAIPVTPAGAVEARAEASSTGDAGAAVAPHEPRAYLVRARGGALAVARGVTEAEAARDGVVVCDLGHPALLRKLTNESGVLGRLARASAATPASFYVKIDVSTAPEAEDARRAAFIAAGVQAQTIAGDVATVRVAPARFGALLGVPWVTSVETPGITMPR